MSVLSPQEIADELRQHPAIMSKLAIGKLSAHLKLCDKSEGRPGDDAAIIPNGNEFDLIAGEGFIPEFVQHDPWFAGWCGVMVNLSDIAAMGGTGVGLVNQIWAPSFEAAEPLLDGLKAASNAYQVPLVGGHTNFSAGALNLAVSVFGRAKNLITSFDARPGDKLIAAVDTRGAYRNFDNFFAAGDAPVERLRSDLAILPTLANDGLVTAGKDISQGGLAGTALMLAECSNVGIELNLDAITPPHNIPLVRWLRSFPSFGYILTARSESVGEVLERFKRQNIHASHIGTVQSGSKVKFVTSTETALFWDHVKTPYLNFSQKEREYA